jgi:hypothetical protein
MRTTTKCKIATPVSICSSRLVLGWLSVYIPTIGASPQSSSSSSSSSIFRIEPRGGMALSLGWFLPRRGYRIQPRVSTLGNRPPGRRALKRRQVRRIRRVGYNFCRILLDPLFRALQSTDFERRNAVGDWAVTWRKTRLKWVNDWKPTSYAISLIRR